MKRDILFRNIEHINFFSCHDFNSKTFKNSLIYNNTKTKQDNEKYNALGATETNYYEFFTPKPKGKKMNKINHFCISNKSINTKKKKLSKQKNLNNIAALS